MENVQATFNVGFFLKIDRSAEKTGIRNLYCRITVNGKSSDMSLNKQVSKEIFNSARKNDIRGVSPEGIKLKKFLQHVTTSITDEYDERKRQSKAVNSEILKLRYQGINVDTKTLCELIKHHNETCGLKNGTLKNYKTTYTYVKNFIATKQRSDLFFSELNYGFLMELAQYIPAHPIDKAKSATNNGVMKHMERLRKIGYLAVKLDIVDKSPFRHFKLKLEKAKKQILLPEQLPRIEALPFKCAMLELVRDIFIFACYTGPHYGDTINLLRTDIRTGMDNLPWIISDREKNGEPVMVPLLPQAIAIMEKYKDDPRAIVRGTVFPYVSNKTMNDKLKIISELAGPDIPPLRFKDARDTFATSVTLYNGVPIESVSKMLGHTRISTTQIYAKIIARKLSNDMQQLREKLLQATATVETNMKNKNASQVNELKAIIGDLQRKMAELERKLAA